MNSDASSVDEYLGKLEYWKKQNLDLFRQLVHEADDQIVEEIKWGVPVFIHNKKMLFAMSSFKEHTKYNFIQNGAVIDDPDKLFNNGLESKKSRGIDLRQNESIDRQKLAQLIDRAFDQAS